MRKLRNQLLLLIWLPVIVVAGWLLGDIIAMPSIAGINDWIALALVVLVAAGSTFIINNRVFSHLEDMSRDLIDGHPPRIDGALTEIAAAMAASRNTIESDYRAQLAVLQDENKRMSRRLTLSERDHQQSNAAAAQRTEQAGRDREFVTEVHFLCKTELQAIIGLVNRVGNDPEDTGLLAELAHRTEQLQFMLGETSHRPVPQAKRICNARVVIDEILELIHPIALDLDTDVQPFVSESVPDTVYLAEAQFRSLLFNFLLYRINHTNQRILRLTVNYTADEELELTLEEPHTTDIPPPYRLAQIMAEVGLTAAYDRLKILSRKHSQAREFPGQGVTAIIVANNDIQRDSIGMRLHQLGVKITTDYKSPDLSVCFVTDEASDTFRAIAQYLSPRVVIFQLNNGNVYNLPNWIGLGYPVNQQQLLEQLRDLRTRGSDPLTPRRVLAVDDSRPNLQLLVLQLEEVGHDVATAKNGREAVDRCIDEPFDLVFMDVQMPECDGIEATRQIRARAKQQPRIIGLTAHVSHEERESCLAAGMDEVIVKPARMSAIEEISRGTRREARPPIAVGKNIDDRLFDLELSLAAANQRAELAAELLTLLIANLPADQQAINDAFKQGDTQALRDAVHKLMGAVRYCGVPRLNQAVERVETIIKSGPGPDVGRALNVLNGEVSSLMLWSEDNPDPFDTREAWMS
ncbi:MAG: response regulator [Proteobacteria bacterium]|nr:response regulator [Pseudomonadota bacterium]